MGDLHLGDFIAVLRTYLQRRVCDEGVYGEEIRDTLFFETHVFSAGTILNMFYLKWNAVGYSNKHFKPQIVQIKCKLVSIFKCGGDVYLSYINHAQIPLYK